MKIAPDSGESGLLLVSAIQSNTISMYFSHLNTINFDEQIDVLPTNNKSEAQDVHMGKSPSHEAEKQPSPQEDADMQDHSGNQTYI